MASALVAPPQSRRTVLHAEKLPVDDVNALTPELAGMRKAFALLNEGLITQDEVAEYAARLSFKETAEVEARRAAETKATEEAKAVAAKYERLGEGVSVLTSNLGAAARRVVEAGANAASEAAGRASAAAMDTVTSAASGAVQSARKSLADAAESAARGAADAAFKAPIRKAQEAVVDAVSTPGRLAVQAIRAPIDGLGRTVNATKRGVEGATKDVLASVASAPSEARKTANVAQYVVRGAAQLAAEALEQRKKGEAVDESIAAPQPPRAEESKVAELVRQDEIPVDGTVVAETLRSLADLAATRARAAA